jgi:mRNA interferase RelE/StbE
MGLAVMQITYTRQAAKTLIGMQPRRAAKIIQAIEKIAENPARNDLDIRKLTNRSVRLSVAGRRLAGHL